jgi:hypothetical protein
VEEISTAKWRTVDFNEIDSDVNEIKTSNLTGTELLKLREVLFSSCH